MDKEFKQNKKVKINTTAGHINVNNFVNKTKMSGDIKEFKKFENENGSIKEETIEEDDEELTNTLAKKKIVSPP